MWSASSPPPKATVKPLGLNLQLVEGYIVNPDRAYPAELYDGVAYDVVLIPGPTVEYEFNLIGIAPMPFPIKGMLRVPDIAAVEELPHQPQTGALNILHLDPDLQAVVGKGLYPRLILMVR
ncbi:hypothetical protein KEJ44_08705 [Candidatus Bathyarchaeota archaeon]|nr:hypothetical protein [Candidatus Bathyarchaeota archaeon]